MAKICETCGYQTNNEQKETCPFCGATLRHSEESVDETVAAPARRRTPRGSIGPLLTPLVLIAVVGVALLYILLAPEQVSKQLRQVTNAWEEKTAEADAYMKNLKEQAKTETDEENAEDNTTGTDPSGNEILTDFEVPGVSVQPEYVLADSARSLWTVVTNEENLNLRAGPGTEYDIIGKLDAGVQVVGCGYSTNGPSNWIVVEINGQYGWACTDYLQQNG